MMNKPTNVAVPPTATAEPIVELTPSEVISPTVIEKWAVKLGFEKKMPIEAPSVIQFKIAILTFLTLLIGDVMIFLSTSIIVDPISGISIWAFTAAKWQTFIVSLLKDLGAVVIGKMLKYYNQKDEISS